MEPIREELENKFRETKGQLDLSKLNRNEPITLDTHVTEGEYAPSEIVTLRVRTETGKRTLIVKLLVTDKVSLLYDCIGPYLENRHGKFVVRTNFP